MRTQGGPLQIEAVQAAILDYSRKNLRDYPWRRGQLTPFQVLLCEFLLRRTHAETIAGYVKPFLSRFPDPRELVRTKESELATFLAPIGLHNQRAHQLKLLADYLVNEEGGKVPGELDRLLLIPGIGEYTARAVLSFGYNRSFAVVDSNVLRVYGRVFRRILGGRPRLQRVQEIADVLVPVECHKQYNFALLDLGATVCSYLHPKCGICPLQKMCDTTNEAQQ